MKENVQTIDRAFYLLELLSDYEDLSLKEITIKTKLNKTTIFRILQSLIENGYIKRVKKNRYSLSFKSFKIGTKAIQNISFFPIAKRYIAKLSNEVNQIIHLVIFDNNEILYLDKYTPNNFDVHMKFSKIGKSAPVYCTAAGKAILAHLPDIEVERIFNEVNVKKYTARTITNYDTLLKDLKRIRENGYSTEFEEYELNLFCIGRAFFEKNGFIAGAISISLPLSEQSNKMYYVNRLIECSNNITKELKEQN